MSHSTWSYRVLKTEDREEGRYGISEVYFDEDGRVWGWTEPKECAETLEEIRRDLERKLAALDKGVILEWTLPRGRGDE